eukprot:PhM_4_TR11218/c0_g1_i1/m.78199
MTQPAQHNVWWQKTVQCLPRRLFNMHPSLEFARIDDVRGFGIRATRTIPPNTPLMFVSHRLLLLSQRIPVGQKNGNLVAYLSLAERLAFFASSEERVSAGDMLGNPVRTFHVQYARFLRDHVAPSHNLPIMMDPLHCGHDGEKYALIHNEMERHHVPAWALSHLFSRGHVDSTDIRLCPIFDFVNHGHYTGFDGNNKNNNNNSERNAANSIYHSSSPNNGGNGGGGVHVINFALIQAGEEVLYPYSPCRSEEDEQRWRLYSGFVPPRDTRDIEELLRSRYR